MNIQSVIERTIDRIQKQPPIARLLKIMDAYGAASGGLLAAGLAYGALFAALTVMLFLVGLTAFVVKDPVELELIVDRITAAVPPLEPIVREGLHAMAENAGALSFIAVIALGWSASQFYGSLDVAFARIFKAAPERGPFHRMGRGIVSIVIVIMAVVAGLVTSSVQALLAEEFPIGPTGDDERMFSAIAYPIVTVLITMLAVAMVYRLVPNIHVPWRTLAPPALLAGFLIASLTQLFVFLAPRLVGSLSLFGGFAAVFAALVWLSWTFQILLIGGAWTRERLPTPERLPGPMLAELVPGPLPAEVSAGAGDGGAVVAATEVVARPTD